MESPGVNRAVSWVIGLGLGLALVGLLVGTLWPGAALLGVLCVMAVPALAVLTGSVLMLFKARFKQGLVGLFLLAVMAGSFVLDLLFFR